MVKPKIELSSFDRRVLARVTEQKRTAKEIWSLYISFHPPTRIAKIFFQPVSLLDVELALSRLLSIDLIKSDLTSYTDRPLRKQTKVYLISDTGRLFLSKKK
jgi:hypothetical protein